MPRSEFFAQFGLLTIPDFLDAATCARLRSEARESARHPAQVVKKDMARVDDELRRTKRAKVSAVAKGMLQDQFEAIHPRVAGYFNTPLVGCEKPNFLLYESGDFFVPHVDNGEHYSEEFAGMRRRRISVVVFLNGEGKEAGADCYAGGALTFYGLLSDPRAKLLGFPLTGETGLLVAFPSDVRHEVTPVTSGERFTVVTWYYD